MEHDRRGDWFVTYTGKQFWPLDPRPGDIDIEDIAHALALQARWNGHTTEFYSVASHSVACAEIGLTEYDVGVARWALMHDAAEAYLSDVIRPLKRYLYFVDERENDIPGNPSLMEPFKVIENHLLQLIARYFALPWPIPTEVSIIDNRMLTTEGLALTRYHSDPHWTKTKDWAKLEPYDMPVKGVSPGMAEIQFRQCFNQLFPEFASI